MSADEFRDQQRKLAENGVMHCLAAYVDVHGVVKAKAVPISHFGRMMRGSELFTGAALDGLGQGPQDDELAVHPDPGAVTQLLWRPSVAWAPGTSHVAATWEVVGFPCRSRAVVGHRSAGAGN